MKYFDENATKVIFTLITLNNFQMNEKDTSKNLLNPRPETEDLITNSHISLSECDSTQSSTINTSNISPSKTTLYQEYQIKLTGDDTSDSMNKITSILESYRSQNIKQNINKSLYLQPQSKLCANQKNKWRAAALLSSKQKSSYKHQKKLLSTTMTIKL